MSRELPYIANPGLPLPVVRLLRRSRDARSPKEAHDAAYFAWEASIRIAVATSMPDDATSLRVGSSGAWSKALRSRIEVLSGEPIRRLFGWLTRATDGRDGSRASVRSVHLLDELARYRNVTIGHGSVRAKEGFYSEGAEILRTGLEFCWGLGVFLEPGSELVFVTRIVEPTKGERRAFLWTLHGENGQLESGPGRIPANHVMASRVYLVSGERWTTLHPWVLFDDRRTRLFCFQALKRRPEYLDFASAEFLRGDPVEVLAPGVGEELRSRLGEGPAEAPAARSSDPGLFGDYRLYGELGAGGMGRVHLAEQLCLGRLVALKRLPNEAARDPAALAKFQREVDALGRCEHPNVVRIFESGVESGAPYCAMEYLNGIDLRQLCESLRSEWDLDAAVVSAWRAKCRGRPELAGVLPNLAETELRSSGCERNRELARLMRDAALGVQALHEQRILHRDLSPANVFLTLPERRVVVMDLGLATLEGRDLSQSIERSRVVGTLRYISPEQLAGEEIDARADVYGLGAVLHELLSDRPMFDGESQARLLEQVRSEEPTPLPAKGPRRVPRDLAKIVRKATDKDPNQRYASARALAEDLTAFLEGRPIAARRKSTAYLLTRWTQRNRMLATSLLVGTLGVLIALSVAIAQGLIAKHEEARGRLLADLKQAGDMVRGASELPRGPLDAEGARAFLREAALLKLRFAEHAAWVDSQEVEPAGSGGSVHAAGTADNTESAAADVPRELTERLKELEQALGSLGDETRGEIARIHRAVTDATTLRSRSIDEHASAWSECIERIAASPHYGSLRIEPQVGLVPIGPDPESKLEEFAHVLSGAIPTRGDLGGALFDEHSAIVMVLVPAGEFSMGSEPCDGSRATQLVQGGLGTECVKVGANCDCYAGAAESPVKKRTLGHFFLSKYEVTQAQWERLDSEHKSKYTYHDLAMAKGYGLRPTSPVDGVAWDQARRVLRRVGLCLPREAQWEYAARAKTLTPWPHMSGNRPDAGLINCADITIQTARQFSPDWVYNSDYNDGYPVHAPVTVGRPNGFGLCHMHGNVMEWCEDRSWTYELEISPDGVPQIDPKESAAQSKQLPILRGGAFANVLAMTRSSHRYTADEQSNTDTCGVRAARRLDTGP